MQSNANNKHEMFLFSLTPLLLCIDTGSESGGGGGYVGNNNKLMLFVSFCVQA